ncbi:MAG: hypothetical protein IPP94_19535 [Ignavibacteria bacterium]|nr:hypothetical protein [Ignavibacteria bacterium]
MSRLLRFRITAVLLLSLTLPGCYSYRVVSENTARADDIHRATVVSLFWGIVQSNDVTAACNGNGLQQVTYKNNFLYSLCTVATLGIVSPADVEYRCSTGVVRGNDDMGQTLPRKDAHGTSHHH